MIQDVLFVPPSEHIDLSNCDQEPIHIPSSIQAHGMLIAARESDLQIVYVSENSRSFLNVGPEILLEQTLIQALGIPIVESIRATLGKEKCIPHYVMATNIPGMGEALLDVVAHEAFGLLYVELEIAVEERSWDLLSRRLESSMHTLEQPKTITGLCTAIPPLLRSITGYDRVMVYGFDSDGNGEVMAEEKTIEMESFLGLHYPASDIPRQARNLYLLQRIRMITDINYVPVPVLSKRDVVGNTPLDMTYCGIRSVSPIHIEYLQNMGVGATLSISIILNNDLWGLIVCHHNSRKHLPPETRASCDIMGQVLSLLIGAVQNSEESSSRLQKRAILDVLSQALDGQQSIETTMADHSEAFLALAEADGAFIRLSGQTHSIGRTPPLSISSSLMSMLKSNWSEEVGSTDQLGRDFPGFSDIAAVASGVLMLALGYQDDGILLFRGELVSTVRWGGDPNAPKQRNESSTRLSPRKSFAAWQQIQRGRASAWTLQDLDAAREMQQILVKALLRHAEDKLQKLAYEDALTGLFNRNALLEQLTKWQNGSGVRPATLLFLDLDDFTRINDQLGYHAGDELLKKVGQRLSSITREKHFIARLSGDEFAVFCEDLDLYGAEKLANTIIMGLAEPLFVPGGVWRLTASVGIAPVQPNELLGWVLKDPLRAADSAMYVAKHKGGNQVSIVDGRQHAKVLQSRIDEDLTKRQLTANELASAYVQLNSVMDSTSQGILQISHEWIVIYGNRRAAEILPDFNVGIDCWKCFPALLSDTSEQHLRMAMTTHAASKFQIDDLSSSRCYEVNVFSTSKGLTLFFNDISEEKKIKDQLTLEQLLREKRIEALSHMAGTLAHEISNPLAIIHGRASDLATFASENKPLEGVKVLAACSAIIKTVNQASSILRGLRGFAREGAQDAMALASIYEMVGEAVNAQSERFEEQDIEIRTKLTPGLPDLICREVQIGQILTNLLNNAFDEIHRSNAHERWVTITAMLEGTNLHLEVTDSGPGVEDRFRAHLMEPFFTTKAFGAGMGVGLSLSRAIAQDHGGSLTLLEGTLNTCFCLVLPVHSFRRRLSDNQIAVEVPYEAI